MASNSEKGKGKGGFGTTHRHRLDEAWIRYVNRKTNNDRVRAKREKGGGNGEQQNG